MNERLQKQSNLIEEKNRILIKEKETDKYKQSLVGDDQVVNVDFVPRLDWR